jgi:hypothetical protein
MRNNHRTTTHSPSTNKHMVLRTICASWVQVKKADKCMTNLATYISLNTQRVRETENERYTERRRDRQRKRHTEREPQV